jgi:hypothetical protein
MADKNQPSQRVNFLIKMKCHTMFQVETLLENDHQLEKFFAYPSQVDKNGAHFG